MNSFLAITCASITGITLGITLQHKQSLHAASLGSAPISHYQAPVTSGSGKAIFGINTTETSEASATPAGSPQVVSFDSSQLEQKLNALIDQQAAMSNQQSELNREINAIQFRLDTHSESFRPLRSERNTETLSPSSAPIGLSPLLPPRS